MRNSSAEHTLLAVLPIIFVAVAIIGAIVLFPSLNTDTRSRANLTPPTPPTAPKVTPVNPETGCSELYKPVCGQDQVTYSNECEAKKAGVAIVSFYACGEVSTQIVLPQGSSL